MTKAQIRNERRKAAKLKTKIEEKKKQATISTHYDTSNGQINSYTKIDGGTVVVYKYQKQR